jgi:hypothetical protein
MMDASKEAQGMGRARVIGRERQIDLVLDEMAGTDHGSILVSLTNHIEGIDLAPGLTLHGAGTLEALGYQGDGRTAVAVVKIDGALYRISVEATKRRRVGAPRPRGNTPERGRHSDTSDEEDVAGGRR